MSAAPAEDILRWFDETITTRKIDALTNCGISIMSFLMYIVISWSLIKQHYIQMNSIMKRVIFLTILLLFMNMVVNIWASITVCYVERMNIFTTYFIK